MPRLFAPLPIPFRLLLPLLFLLLPPCPPAGAAPPLISASYREYGGERIVLALEISAPPPSTIIVTQRTPAGTAILNASPPARKADSASGEVKWLLTGVAPGILLLQTTLAAPLSGGGLSAEIRYREQVSGLSRVITVTP